MTAVYDKLGVKFMYPENWQLTDSGSEELPHELTLDSPDGGAMWSVQIYPGETDTDDLLTETLQTLRSTYEDFEVAAMNKTTADGGSKMEEESPLGIEGLFYCLDFLVRVRLQAMTVDDRCLLLWYQAEDRDFEKLELVFKAVTASLLQNV